MYIQVCPPLLHPFPSFSVPVLSCVLMYVYKYTPALQQLMSGNLALSLGNYTFDSNNLCGMTYNTTYTYAASPPNVTPLDGGGSTGLADGGTGMYVMHVMLWMYIMDVNRNRSPYLPTPLSS